MEAMPFKLYIIPSCVRFCAAAVTFEGLNDAAAVELNFRELVMVLAGISADAGNAS